MSHSVAIAILPTYSVWVTNQIAVSVDKNGAKCQYHTVQPWPHTLPYVERNKQCGFCCCHFPSGQLALPWDCGHT